MLVEVDRRIAGAAARGTVSRDCDDAATEAREATRDLLADAPIAEDRHRASPERLAQGRPDLAFLETLEGQGNVAREHQHVRDGQFGDGLGVARPDTGNVGHDNAGGGRRGNVHAVEADPVLLNQLDPFTLEGRRWNRCDGRDENVGFFRNLDHFLSVTIEDLVLR